jgi:RHS repeat-associated protein
MRIYNPQIGKFLSVDPIAYIYPFQGSYVFAANNPITLVDILVGMGPGDPKTHTVK